MKKQFDRLFEIVDASLQSDPEGTVLAGYDEDTKWKEYSSRQFNEFNEKVACGLLQHGIGPGEPVLICSDSRPEWNFVDFATQKIGGILVPIYPSAGAETYQHILKETEAKLAFAENGELAEKLVSASEGNGTLDVFTFEETQDHPHWRSLLTEPTDKLEEELEARQASVEPDEVATIIYTSGTTGKPKGVQLTHRNISSNVTACLGLLPVEKGDRALSFLPLSHVFERMIVYLYLAGGVEVYYAESTDTVGRDLRAVQPNIFTTVPRLLEKVYERLVSKGRELNPIRRMIFFWALNLARNFDFEPGPLYQAQHWLADRLVFSEWRAALGGRVRAAVSGGAPLDPSLARIFTGGGIPILEGYGLTETSPVIAVNRMDPARRKIGTVGPPIDNVEVKIGQNDEILCQGPNVTPGYFKRPDATEQAFDDDGWFHTKDIGSLDEQGFLAVHDRLDNVFKTAGGKFVAPQTIQNQLEQSFLIGHALVIGEDRKMVTALISPDYENLQTWAEEHGVEADQPQDLVELPEVKERFGRIIREKNKGLDHAEVIKQCRLVKDRWSVETGELTPTMKIKRELLLERYQSLIEEMYQA